MKHVDSDVTGGDSLFRGLLESAPDAMVIVDKTGAIVLINSQTEKLFGYPREELLGQSVEVLVPQRFRSLHPGHRNTYCAEPRPRGMGADLDLYGLKKNGDEFPVERILVIEDNPTNLELMTYLLNGFGHTTIVARDGEEGVEVALRTNPDLILCDIALPKLDGYGVARRLKAESTLNGVPLIAVTASAMVGDRDKVVTSGFDGYISKPITPETFVAEVEGHLHPREEHGDHSGR